MLQTGFKAGGPAAPYLGVLRVSLRIADFGSKDVRSALDNNLRGGALVRRHDIRKTNTQDERIPQLESKSQADREPRSDPGLLGGPSCGRAEADVKAKKAAAQGSIAWRATSPWHSIAQQRKIACARRRIIGRQLFLLHDFDRLDNAARIRCSMRQRLWYSIAERGRWCRLSFQRGIARVCRRNRNFTFRANLYLPGLADRVERPRRPWMESYNERTRERRPHRKWQPLVRCSSSAGRPWNAIASDVHFLVGLSVSRATNGLKTGSHAARAAATA